MSKFYRKVGGLHFFRLWRIRVSFCLAKSTSTPTERNHNDGRPVAYVDYLIG